MINSNMKVVYMCKDWGLRERSLTANRAFRTDPQVKKGVLDLKITKKHIYNYVFEKEDLFELHMSKKRSL